MRLSALVPSISADSVKVLEGAGIRTDTDLLFTPTSEIYKRLPRGSISLQELARLCTAVTELTSANPVIGIDALQREEARLARDTNLELAVGNEAIDNFLRGLGGRKVIEISGNRASGKTALALNLVLNHLSHHPNDKAAWIDVLGDFSPANASAILQGSGSTSPQSVLERLLVSLAFDLETLHAILDELFVPGSTGQLKYLVIDSITPLLGPFLTGITAHGHAMMTDFMRRLRCISSSDGVTVLVVNSATLKQGVDGTIPSGQIERKPALGPSFTFMTDTTLWLSEMKVQATDEPVDASIESVSSLKILNSRNTVSLFPFASRAEPFFQ
ncbi:hypothetical protein CC1G_06263 [Coprinopsis cinerea okayama7|uniref:Rad51-like C-terminal domain-containing protein n=1 Tax=Coprinopsis cinerea (strain Okayama-7 / 130 / ATCC MYA-4618 / FGSC 9003) TaxID=240176 RepID=A8NT95_COPC7|nr:hypothetical protein CC1G_06263 [Coprinopsis cinerea okayama7\|eukprot:XP_001836178.2 hypothetical protein CC1G_06263 [Coprinopsis cinerea okayama7\